MNKQHNHLLNTTSLTGEHSRTSNYFGLKMTESSSLKTIYHVVVWWLIMAIAVSCQLEEDERLNPKASFNRLTPAKRDTTGPKNVFIEVPSYFPSPQAQDLNPVFLRKMLGKDADSQYVAVTKEQVLLRKQNDSRELQVYRKLLVRSMPKNIKDLDFTMPGLKKNLGPRASRKLQLWLWKMSSCPVMSKWKYFGVRYWPPWRNVGRCAKKPSCSFPKGMRCKKAETKNIAALRWVCKPRKSKSPRVYCQWMKTSLAVITKCKCMCSQSKAKEE